MRGDGPNVVRVNGGQLVYSLHAWGWTDIPTIAIGQVVVFPTCVGMDRNQFWASDGGLRIPYMRGDGPCTFFLYKIA